ncbi:transmembrane protein [Ceratobasidium sp. AG-Ba]|nr:transmembrane protein [Ceratobasidium sp. AG-Ba]QRW07032.1 transmembrane protein [Ceratobasidium sp. AG-Ba]
MGKLTRACSWLALVPLLYSPLAYSQQLKNKTIDDSQVFNLDIRRDGIQYSHDQATYQASPNGSEIRSQALLWSQNNLGPGDHYIKLCHTGPRDNRLTLDYFVIESDHEFIPQSLGPAASAVPIEALFVDDTNLDQLTYSDMGWSPQNWVEHFNDTMQVTDQADSQVTFKFNGTAVWYFASRGRDRGKFGVTLDGGEGLIIDANWDVSVYQMLLWNATDLKFGEHTVVLTHSDKLGSYMGLDFFRYLPGIPAQKHQSSVGLIVGGVLGGLALLGFVCLGICFCIRRRRKSSELQQYFTPPLLNSDRRYRESAAEPFMTQPFTGLNPPPRVVNQPVRRKGSVNASPANNQMESSTGTSYITESTPSERTRPDDAYEETLPPAYQPYRRPSP